MSDLPKCISSDGDGPCEAFSLTYAMAMEAEAASDEMLALIKDLYRHGYTNFSDHDRVKAMIAKHDPRFNFDE